MGMFSIELNSVKSGERILVLPTGDIRGRDGRYWHLTMEDAVSVVNTINADGVDIVIDYEHGSHSYRVGDGRAAGWLSEFRAEENGVTAKLDFTQEGQKKVDDKEYRYLSPAFNSKETRILALLSVGLTNTPNLTDLPALNRREVTTPGEDMPDKTSPQKGVQGGEAPPKQPKTVEEQLNAMGGQLQDLTTQLNALRSENTGLLATITELRGELAKRETQNAEMEINALVETAITDGKLAPAQRESALKLGQADKAALNSLIQNSALNMKELGQPASPPPAGKDGMGKLGDEDLQVCNLMGISPEDYLKNKEDV